jgi:hypothetical protein
MGIVRKSSPREDKRTRADRRDSKKKLAGQVRRAERHSLSPWARLICLLTIGT